MLRELPLHQSAYLEAAKSETYDVAKAHLRLCIEELHHRLEYGDNSALIPLLVQVELYHLQLDRGNFSGEGWPAMRGSHTFHYTGRAARYLKQSVEAYDLFFTESNATSAYAALETAVVLAREAAYSSLVEGDLETLTAIREHVEEYHPTMEKYFGDRGTLQVLEEVEACIVVYGNLNDASPLYKGW